MFSSHTTDRFLSRVLAGLAITVVTAFAALTHAVVTSQSFI
jgi:hypothetical protein